MVTFPGWRGTSAQTRFLSERSVITLQNHQEPRGAEELPADRDHARRGLRRAARPLRPRRELLPRQERRLVSASVNPPGGVMRLLVR